MLSYFDNILKCWQKNYPALQEVKIYLYNRQQRDSWQLQVPWLKSLALTEATDCTVIETIETTLGSASKHSISTTSALTTSQIKQTRQFAMANCRLVWFLRKIACDWEFLNVKVPFLTIFSLVVSWTFDLKIKSKLWFHCGRIVVLGLPASHLSCNTNTNGEYGGWQSSSKTAFWMAASAWADMWSGALSSLQVAYFFLNWKNS